MPISFVSASTAVGTSAASTMSFSHTATSGTDAFVGVGFRSSLSTSVDVSGVNYAGAAMTSVATAKQIFGAPPITFIYSLWRINAPTTGTQTIDITFSQSSMSQPPNAVAAVYSGSTGILTTVATGTGNTSSPSVTLSMNNSTSWMVGGFKSNFQGNFTTGTGMVSRGFTTSPGTFWQGDRAPGTSGAQAFTMNTSAVGPWCMAACELVEAAGAPAAFFGWRTMVGVGI